MKRFFTGLIIAAAVSAALTGCGEEYTTYNDRSYVMFSNAHYIYPVQQTGEAFEVPIASTTAEDRDRAFGIEVIYKGSNAVYNRHYTLESSTVVIKAGERTASVKVRGIYDNIGNADSLGFKLRIVSLDQVEWDTYGLETKVTLYKSCPFDINNFTGYCLLRSMFFSSTAVSSTTRLITSEAVEGEENTILLRNYFMDGYHVKVRFDPSDPLDPKITTVGEPMVGDSRYFFNYIYDDGRVRMREYTGLTSFFSSCEMAAIQYVTVYVDNVGNVGTYGNVLEWISDDDAQDYM